MSQDPTHQPGQTPPSAPPPVSRPAEREQSEPTEAREPVPVWLLSLIGVLLLWGAWYLVTYSGGFRGDVLDERAHGRFTTASGPPAGPIDTMTLGSRIYRANCVSCHQAEGQGITGIYPPLAGSEWVAGEHSAPRLKRILLHGLEGPVRVRDQTYSGAMPSFGIMRDEHLAALMTYVRNAFGNSADEITPQSVAATRNATRDRHSPWRAEELLRITEDDLREAPTTAPSAE